MKLFLAIFFSICILSFHSVAQDTKEYYFKFNITNRSEIDIITDIISIDNVINNEVYAYALPQQLDEFLKLGYKIDFIDKTVPKSLTMATTVADMSNWDRYPTYEVYRQMMKNFESDYPAICKLDSIGTTNDGRQLYVLNISDNVGLEENEPEFFYTSTMHGDETTGYIMLLRLVDSLLSNYDKEADIKYIIDEINLFINPNANPDGTYNGGNHTVSGAIRSNGYADLNRDYPDPRTGPNSPYQPETQAMMNFAEDHHFVMSANFHGGAAVMNYPWDTWYIGENLHADTEWFEQVCTDYVTTARTVYSNYMTGITSDGVTHGATWYKIGGGRQDYMNFWHQCREVTIEISDSKLLATESLNAYWNYNKQSLINYMKESLYGIRGSVTNSCNEPLEAMLWVIEHDEENDSSMVFTDPAIGDYHRLIEPGSYNVVVSADGFINDTIFDVNVAKGNTNWINFKLTSKDDSILLRTNKEIIEDTLFFDEISLQQLIIHNDSNAINTDYNVELETQGTWIELNKNSGTIYVNENDTVQVIFNTELLTAGYYHNNMILTSADCIIDTIPVHLVVKDTISTEINPKQIIDTLWAGEGSEYEILIENNGIISLNYNINFDPLSNWITVNKLSGNLQITECDTLIATIDTDGYGFGALNCSLLVEKENSTNDTIPVSIYVKDTIEYSINPGIITDTLRQDTIVVYKLIVNNLGYSNIEYTTHIEVPTNSNSYWASTNDTVGTILPENNDTIKINVNTSNLNSEDYSSALLFTESSGKETLIPIDIHVNLVQSIPFFSNVQDIKLYPNPFKNDLMLECKLFEPEDITFSIYNIYGSLLFRKVISVDNSIFLLHLNEIFNIQDLPNAIYLIQISTEMNQNTLKVIKN